MQVPRFEPFPALRYAPDQPLEQVVAPPYDVLSVSDVEALGRRHPHNIVHVDVPLESQGPGRYQTAAETLATWRRQGVVHIDPLPTFTLYRMSDGSVRAYGRNDSGQCKVPAGLTPHRSGRV